MRVIAGKNTVAQEVAAQIEKAIIRGILKPNQPLASSRVMAEQLKISQRSVICAWKILEDKGLIIRQERKKVFVRASSNLPELKEILFFTAARNLTGHSVYQALSDFTVNPAFNRYFNFTLRSVSNVESPLFMNQEIAGFERFGFVDSAVIYTGNLSFENLLQCLKLPYPIVLIGDLPQEIPPEFNFTQIKINFEKIYIELIDYALKENFRQIDLFGSELFCSKPFEKSALEKMSEYAEFRKIRLNKILIPGGDALEIAENFQKLLPKITAGLSKHTLIGTLHIHSGKFDTAENWNFITLNPATPDCNIRHIRRDYRLLEERLFRLLNKTTDSLKRQTTESIDIKTEFINPFQLEK